MGTTTSSTTRRPPAPIAVYHEHPDWFRPLFAELERRGLPYERLDAAAHAFDPGETSVPWSLVFNRASPSAYLRGHAQTTFYTLHWLRHLERLGVPVVNGSGVYGLELSKATQLDLLQELGLPYPRARVINSPAQAVEAARALRYPVLVKANVGGSGAGITRYDTPDALAAAVAAGAVALGVDGTALVQEAAPLRGGHVTRVETLGGRYLYAIDVYPAVGSFDLCPADACQTTSGVELVRGACAIDAPKTGLRVEGTTPPAAIVAQVERIARRAGLDVGGIEYLVDDRDGQPYFYDVNALSNFVADAPNVVGFDPWVKLVDYLEERVASAARPGAGGTPPHWERATESRERRHRSLAHRARPPPARHRGGLTMRYGYWLPVFGGWLRNVDDEGMEASWSYVKRLARRSEELGYDLTLVAELLLNDIKGIDAPSLDAWSTAAALAAVTERLELMVAVRPSFHPPAILAKQAANIDRISNGRLALNVVSAWWKDEARRYGVSFDEHDDRYARTGEWLDVVDGAWREPLLRHDGRYYRVEDLVLEPKPVRRDGRARPTLYAGGESEAAKTLIARKCDAYVMHGDAPERVAPKVADMRRRREEAAARLDADLPPMTFGMAAYAIVRPAEAEARRELERITNVAPGSPGYRNYQDWIGNTQLDQRVSLEDYSVSNRGLRAGLVGTPEQVAERVRELQRAGVDLLLLQCSPQLEEMERFAAEVIPLVEGRAGRARSAA